MSNPDNSIESLRLALHQARYWHDKDVLTLRQECDWLKTQIKTLSDPEKKALYQQHLTKRQQKLKQTANQTFSPEASDETLITAELEEFYGSVNLIPPDDLSLLSPRHRFLLQKRQFIRDLQKTNTHKKKSSVSLEEQTGEKRHLLKAIFDIIKKFIDIIDDLWSLLRLILIKKLSAYLFNLIGPLLTGGVGFIIHSVEAFHGIREAWRAFHNKHQGIEQRKTRGFVGFFIFLLGSVGTGLSITYIAGALGAVVSGMSTLPILIPVFLSAIYVSTLYKHSYILYQAIKNERQAKSDFETAQQNITEEKAKQDNNDFGRELIDLENKKQCYGFRHEEKLKAERKVLFTSIEVTASLIVLVGTILGLSTAAVSFGIAPLAILVVGVSLGLACKAIEYYEEKHDYKLTQGLRNLFTRTWNSVFSSTPKKSLSPSPASTQAFAYADILRNFAGSDTAKLSEDSYYKAKQQALLENPEKLEGTQTYTMEPISPPSNDQETNRRASFAAPW